MIKYLRIILFATIGLSAAFFTVSCDKDMSISLDNDNLDNLLVTEDDTLSATVATVQMPNIPANGSTVILVGKVTQPITGSLKSSSYFRLNPTNITSDIPSNANFDSLNLVLVPSNQRILYGDSTKLQTISAHRLTQSLEVTTISDPISGLPNPIYSTESAIFGQQKFNYATESLGSVSFLPKVNKSDTVSLRLSDALGKEFFDKIKTSDIAFNSASNFQEYFKGLTLVPDETNTAMIGFSDTLEVKVNYSYIGSDGFKKNDSKVLTLSERALQYNHIEKDVSNTAFAGLTTENAIASSKTSGVSYVQGGSGVVTEIKFPALKEFLLQPGLAVNQAELEITLETPHTGIYPAIPNPILMIADSRVAVSFVTRPFENTPQYATYLVGNNSGVKGRYVFNLIQYIKSVLEENAEEESLYLTLAPNTGLGFVPYTSVLATENNKPKVKLNIVYTKFK